MTCKLYNLEDPAFQLDNDDLFIKVYDSSNSLVDPLEITASIMIRDIITGNFIYSDKPDLNDITPLRDSTGFYYLDLLFSSILFEVAEYKVQWSIKLHTNSNLTEASDYFVVANVYDC